MSCICQKCGRKYKVDLIIPDMLWKIINGGKNLLCGLCIMENVENLDKYRYLKVVNKKP